MASPFVSGTYQSYKAGTGKVLHWLHENALRCGYVGQKLEQTEESDEEGEGDGQAEPKRRPKSKKKPKRGKGSKVKGGGKAKSKKAGITGEGSAPKYVALKEYTALAEAIAAFKPKVKVPVWVTSMVAEVISARKKSARWFSRQAGDTISSDFEQSNQGHQHFIEVLENIQSILTKLQGPNAKSAAVQDDLDDKDPLDRISNMFHALEIEPDTEHTLTEPEPSKPKPQKPNTNVVFEEERSVEESLWLIYCFFEDFNIAREHLKDLWTTYKHGSLDLTTAALSTNTAFELFKRAEDELLVDLRSTLPPSLMGQMNGGQDVESRRSPEDPYNYYLFDIADWTAHSVYLLLIAFMHIRQSGLGPVCQPGYFGELNLNEDVLYPGAKFIQDKIFLLERFLPELIFLMNVKSQANDTVKFPAEDELTGGVLEMVRTKQIPMWLVLALQVQLDIHYMLLGDIDRPYSELSAAATRATTTIETYQDFSNDMYLSTWPKANDDILKLHLWECDQWILTDVLGPLRSETYASLGYPSRGEYVLCGMMLFRSSLIMQEVGMSLVNAWGSLPAVLHLYNACLADHLLEKPWIDMEAIIHANTAERIFVGDRPQTPKEYLTRFMLVLGHSATTFSANRRANTGLAISKKGPRQMLKISIIAEIYSKPYLKVLETRDQHSLDSGFTLAAVEKLLEEAAATADNKPSSEAGAFTSRLIQNRPKIDPSKVAKSRRLTTIQLLTALASSMTHETFAFNVNYFSLHMRCFRLLRAIAAAGEMNALFVKYIGPMYIERESELPILILFGGMKSGAVLFPNIRNDGRGSKILFEANRIVNEVSNILTRIEWNREVNPPTLNLETLESAVEEFNALPRHKKIPTGPGPNHWHFSIRSVGPRLSPPDLVYLISPANDKMHVAATPKGEHILTLPTLSDQADMVVLLLLLSFVGGLLKGEDARFPKFAPWTWSCNDAALAREVEGKLKLYGVRDELCTVLSGSVEINGMSEDELSDDVWAGLRDELIMKSLEIFDRR
ncbi:hypothetical protein LSUE1_G004193 [Lachnellula suecica]|uniref:DUF6604 domain-containing protein n=1 Tax=Lachnellula suecica TaxID=602035 RepID=A0A8T9C3C6_9HELO|nr:hypothetical protein LSUE1_G004193 [Lachnellula suecica]